MAKKSLVIILAVIIVVALAVWLINVKKPGGLFNQNVSNVPVSSSTPEQVEKIEVSTDQLPEHFPSNFPLESGVKITQNYNAIGPNVIYQATRVFETKKTLDANFKLYKDFLTKDGWTIGTTINQPTFKVIPASKDNLRTQVTMNQNSVTKVKTVDISVSAISQN